MKIHAPLCITSRLLPGCRIGGVEISIEYAYIKNSRQAYRYFIDGVTECGFRSTDLQSGARGGTLQKGLETLLGFLGAFAEAVAYQPQTGQELENANLFPAELEDWAIENVDEISMMESELQERQLIEE